jgi:hypothetical protein
MILTVLQLTVGCHAVEWQQRCTSSFMTSSLHQQRWVPRNALLITVTPPMQKALFLVRAFLFTTVFFRFYFYFIPFLAPFSKASTFLQRPVDNCDTTHTSHTLSTKFFSFYLYVILSSTLFQQATTFHLHRYINMPQVTIEVPERWEAAHCARALGSYCRKRGSDDPPDMDYPSDDDPDRLSGRPLRAKKIQRTDDEQRQWDDCIMHLKRHYLRYLSLEEPEIAPIIHRYYNPEWSINDPNFTATRTSLTQDVRCWQFQWLNLFEVCQPFFAIRFILSALNPLI